jgi:predicted nuclease of restriction endonuclease-like (RecB) superfamily
MYSELDRSYGHVLQGLKEKIRQARLQAAIAVNSHLLQMYWDVGKLILDEQRKMGWGARIIDKLAFDLKMEFSDMKGFSARNLKYMRAFAEAYPGFSQPAGLQSPDNQIETIVQAAPAQLENTPINTLLIRLTWYHHTTLLDKVKDPETRRFYIHQAAGNGWSRDMMVHQIVSGLHERRGRLTHNFKQTLPDYQSDLTQQLFKDPYQLDFIALGKVVRERDLEKAFIDNITKVLIELGDGFAFMGRQYKLEVGGQEFFLDLLFYHAKLHRYVVIELKTGDFLPEYAGKMNFYLNVADDKLKGEHDGPSIGLILCKTNNKVVAEYALRDMSKPIGISEYRINELLPESIKRELPSIQDLEQKLEERLETPFYTLDAKLARIKEMTKSDERRTG